MTTYYLDTSALIKRYVAEVGSHWIVNIVNSTPNSPLFTSRLTLMEVRSALARRRREASITQQNHTDAVGGLVEDSLTRYRFIELDPIVIELASELLEHHPLRAYDAVQLASALRISRALEVASLPTPTFLSADDHLLVAAQAEGFSTDNPNRYP